MMHAWPRLLFMTLALVTACNQSPEPSAAPESPAAAQERTFHVKGIVQALHPEQKQIEIRHEAIPGYMPAMTMPFEVKNTNELAGLAAGEPISFRLTVTATDAWIDQLHIQGPPATNGPPTSGPFRQVRDVEPLKPGDPLPAFSLTNQLGRRFSTDQFRGQALAINFLFTRCPFPTFCPRTASNFAAAQQKLLESGGPTNWHLLTISFDPAFDTPPVLRGYAGTYHYDPAHWTFATGDLIDITALADLFGQIFWHDESGGISHNLRCAVVDTSGRLRHLFEGNQWTSDELVKEIRKAAEGR